MQHYLKPENSMNLASRKKKQKQEKEKVYFSRAPKMNAYPNLMEQK